MSLSLLGLALFLIVFAVATGLSNVLGLIALVVGIICAIEGFRGPIRP